METWILVSATYPTWRPQYHCQKLVHKMLHPARLLLIKWLITVFQWPCSIQNALIHVSGHDHILQAIEELKKLRRFFTRTSNVSC